MPKLTQDPMARRNGPRIAIDPCYLPLIDEALRRYPGTYKSRPDVVNAAVDYFCEHVILPTNRMNDLSRKDDPED